jgi:glycosyltransferase involved in cell wall biosynthesis
MNKRGTVKRLVLVLGMYRSGLTAVEKSLAALGLGREMSGASKGFWKDRACSAINEELLSQRGVRHPLDVAWEPLRADSRIDRLQAEVSNLVSGRLRDHDGSWGFADPRLCRLSGFWTDVLAAVDAEVTWVIAARNPASVAASLAIRYGIGQEKACLLWLQHVLPSLTLPPTARRIVVDYDDLLATPASQLLRLADALQLPPPAPEEMPSGFLERGRRHIQSSEAELAEDSPVSSLAVRAYGLLRRLATDQESPTAGPDFRETLAGLNDEFDAVLPACRLIKSYEDEPASHRPAETTRRETNADFDPVLSPGEEQLTELTDAATGADDLMARLESSIAGRGQQLVRLKRAASRFRESGAWRIARYRRYAYRLLIASGEIMHVRWWQDLGLHELPEDFDADRYLTFNPDVAMSGVEPAIHYLNHGRWEGRRFKAERSDPFKAGGSLPNRFDSSAYLKLNPDVAASGTDPAHHYWTHGRREGRPYAFRDVQPRGAHHVRAGREAVLLVGHDAGLTGAPVLSLNLVHKLVGRYNVVVLLLGDGPLADSFVQAGAATLVSSSLRNSRTHADYVVGRLHERFNFKFALVNSIESRAVLPALAVRFIPALSLVHEFAAYTRPRDAFTEALFWSSDVVFSADVTQQNALQSAPDLNHRHVHVLPQGRCFVPMEQVTNEQLEEESNRLRRLIRPAGSSDLTVVLGAGTVQLRKGVELFIEIAARVVAAPEGRNCRFLWLGYGYDPDHDVGYSVYLADQIQRAGLENHIMLAGETPAIEAAYEEADIFLLSSRLDPLPNVAVDALAYGTPVLCFDRATGIADFLKTSGLASHCVAQYLDTAEMADKILALAGSHRLRRDVGERGRDASLSFFSMKSYVAGLEGLARAAADGARHEQQGMEVIVDSGLFRRDFTVPPNLAHSTLDYAVRMHVRAWASGIGRRKPFPGFHPGIYLEQHGVAIESTDPTADYIRAGQPDGPWNTTVIVEAGSARRPLPENRRIALHLHVFYPELLPEITMRLSRNRVRPDLLISVTSERVRDLVARHLKDYSGRVAAIEVVPNRGRDIGPLLTAFGPHIVADYEFVGHIHTKKTADIKDPTFVTLWYQFLLENLLGGKTRTMADTILAAMKDDESIGMVFPDDPNVVGWGANRQFAEPLAARLGLAQLPRYINFPVGTMFWARTRALIPFMNLQLQWHDYPEEPLPYDGTVLHAIERLLPLTLPAGQLRPAHSNVVGVTR